MEKINFMSSELKSPAFQFYAQDFLTGIMYLTNEEVGIYIKILAKQWTDGPIPKKRVGLLVGLDWDKFSEELKEKFQENGDTLVNLRLEKERVKKSKFLNKQKINGSKGGRPKKENTQNNPSVIKNKTQKNPLEEEEEVEYEIENTSLIKKDKNKIPEFGEFFEYARTLENYSTGLDFTIKAKYDSWIENNWKDGNGNKIKNWKTKLRNTWPHLKPIHKPKDDGRISAKDYFNNLRNGTGLPQNENKFIE